MPIRPKQPGKPAEPQRFPGDLGRKYDVPLGRAHFAEQAMGENLPMQKVEPPARPRMPALDQYDENDLMKRATQGSRPFSKSELRRGYRRV